MGRKQKSRRPPPDCGHQNWDGAVPEAGGRRAAQQGPARRDDTLPVPASGTQNCWQVLAACGFLLLAVGLVFGQTVRYQFVNFDDNSYVYENSQVSRGLTAQGIVWAFTHRHAGYWMPLTWISLMLDCQLYGLNAGGHHLTNALLHAVTAILLFLVLWRMTGRCWPSLLVAALFAVHPLHVESVAWVTERKDVLSGLLFMLTLGAYTAYVSHPFSLVRYLVVMIFFALGLMAKPMLVTVPFVLLLLDYWPLGRVTSAASNAAATAGHSRLGRFSVLSRLLCEKLPLLLLAAVFCLVTSWTMAESMGLNQRLSITWRIANALVSYVAYLGQFFWPAGLAVLYPHPGSTLPVWKAIGALVVLACISAGALATWRRYPYWLMGWLWYLGMLVPVLGLIQSGSQTRADRFTYLTQIGLYIALAWALADACRSLPYRRWLDATVSALVLAVLMGGAWRQTSFWRDNETLWTHALACTSRNGLAHNNLGVALASRGRVDEAIQHYRQALEVNPRYADAHNNLGIALAGRGRVDEAIQHYRQALEVNPDYAEAHKNWALALAKCGQLEEAIAHYLKVIEIRPDDAEAHYNLSVSLIAQGRLDEAIAHYRQGLEIAPDDANAHYRLGLALESRGRIDEAITQYRQVVKIKPDHVEAGYHLGTTLAGRGQFKEAIAQFERVVAICPTYAEARNNLGAALQSQGRIDEAVTQYRKALQIKPDYIRVYFNLGRLLAGRGQFKEAIAQFERALKLKPDDVEVQNILAWLLATSPEPSLRSGAAAIEHALRADRLCGGKRVDVLDTLAAAYAEAGRRPEAAATAHKALDLAVQQGNQHLADALRARIALYEAGKAYRETLPAPSPRPPQR